MDIVLSRKYSFANQINLVHVLTNIITLNKKISIKCPKLLDQTSF